VNFRETNTFTNYISSGEREKRSVPRLPEIRADRDRFDSNPVPRKTSESEGTGLPDFGTFLATFLRFPIHSESYREIYPPATIMRRGIKKSAGGSVAARALAARFIPGDLESGDAARGCCPTNFTSHLAPSPLTVPPTAPYAKQPPGQVPLECLRNRRFCPSSDEHHCLSICLSVYRIDIRKW